MPRNASGIYTLPGGNPVTPGDVIEASWANTTLEDVADALTNSLSRTGAGGMLAPFRIADGNISAPGLSYLNETNTGLYRSGSGSTWMAVLGVNVAQFSTVGLTVPFGKALTAAGNASVAGTFGVTGATTLASTLAVTGAITATGGVSGNVTGNVTAASGTSSFNDVVISGSLDMTAGSSATITGLSTPTNASDAANKGYVDTQDALRLALTGGTMSGAIAMGSSKITGLATPTADADAATKAYVDSVAQGLDVKGSCRVATVANITLSGTQTIDGVAVIAGDRVLVKDQSTAANNGIYVVAAGSWSRAADADTWSELVGAFTFVEEGTVNDNSGWVCTSPAGGTLGVTAVTWEQFSGAGQITAGAGMYKSGNTLNVGTASSSRIVVGTDDIDLATTGVTASTYKSVTVDAYGRVTAGTNPTTLAGFGITDAYTQAQVNTALALKLNLTGGTMSGAIAMGTNKITGLGDPTLAQDAATKNYIDTIFGSTTSAAASAAAAASSASAAATSATNAASSATSAAGSATSAASSYTTFNNQYLGSKASDPSTNNTGGALVAGNLYWNSTTNEMRVYSGSAWTVAYVPSGSYMDLTTNQTAAGVKTFSSNPILSGGTANGVTYLNGSKVLTSGSALTFDGTNLGIGTSSPNAALKIVNATNPQVIVDSGNASVESRIRWYKNGSPVGSIYSDSGNFTILSEASIPFLIGGGTEGMRLTSTGLGIGTSSVTEKLTVQSTGNTIGSFQSSGASYVGVQAYNSSQSFSMLVRPDVSNALVFRNETTGSNYLTLTTAGNFGVGTTSPTQKLHVSATTPVIRIDATAAYNASPTATLSFVGTYNSGAGLDGFANIVAAKANATSGDGSAYLAFSTNTSTGNMQEKMRLDSAGNLGLGVTSMSTTAQIAGSTGLTLGAISGNTWRTAAIVPIDEGAGYKGSLAFYTHASAGTPGAPTERARIDSSGNLGLGVTPSAWGSAFKAMQIGTGGAVWGSTSATEVNIGGNTRVDANNAQYDYINTGAATQYQQVTGTHKWFIAPSGTAGTAISFTQAMTLTASGVLQVGSTSSSDNRIVAGGVSTYRGVEISTSTASARPTLTLINYNTATYGSYIQDSSAGDLCFGRVNYDFGGHVERVRIDSSGNLLVGKTAANNTTAGVFLRNDGYGSFAANGVVLDVNKLDGDGQTIRFYRNSTQVGNISVSTGATAYNTSSDYRLKNTIAPMTGALAKVAQLKPVTYKWNADGSDGEGFIAHELAEVVPQCVTGEKDAVDAEGNPQYQGIDTSFLVATLTAALQELNAKFDAYVASHP